jgi:hypothetical protein
MSTPPLALQDEKSNLEDQGDQSVYTKSCELGLGSLLMLDQVTQQGEADPVITKDNRGN